MSGKGLLVDDDALYLRTLARSLGKRGFDIRIAMNTQEALRVAEVFQPDFALVDLKLGNQSGLDLIAPLRHVLPETSQIVLVTGYSSVATAVEAMKRGADDYLPKPVSIAAIMRVLDGQAVAEEAVAHIEMLPLSRVEWEHIQQAMTDTDGNVSAAARLLGMHRRTLQRKLAKRPSPFAPPI